MCKKREDYLQILKMFFYNARENHDIVNIISRELMI